MYSMTLFMVEMSFISLATSGFTHTSAVFSIASSSASQTRPVKLTSSAMPSSRASAFSSSSDVPPPTKPKCTSVRRMPCTMCAAARKR